LSASFRSNLPFRPPQRMLKRLVTALAFFAITGLLSVERAAAQQAQQIGSVFVILMENHNFTQPSSDTSSGLQPIFGNAAAPYINSLITPGSANAADVSYATAYHNVLASVSGGVGNIHPSEPNYIWLEAGSNYGVANDNDPYGGGGNVATVTMNNGGATPEHLTQLLQIAGISWRSYQEDTNLLNSSGQNFNTSGGTLTSNVAGPNQYTVPLLSFGGNSSSYTNPYNGSHYYSFACKHDGSLFFADTNGNGVATSSNPEVSHYAPLQQLAADLANNTVARYNVITPNLYNDMHNGLPGGFTYHGTLFTDDQANIAQGDNFLSILVPQIMASQAFRDNGLIIICADETEGTSPNDFNHTLPEIILSPLAKGNAYAGALNYTHSSDVATMQQIFGVAAATASGYLGDAANPSNPNTDGTGAAQDLSDLFKSQTAFATLTGLPSSTASAMGHMLREHYPLSANATDAQGLANLTAQPSTGNGISYPASGGIKDGGYLHLSGTGYLLASLASGSNFSALGDYSTFKPFSMSFWVRQTAAQQSAGGATESVIGMTTSSTNSSTWNTGFEMATRENTTNLNFELRDRNGGSGTSDAGQLDTGLNISDGNWHHVALTYTANSRYAYIDGASRGVNNTTVAITTNPIANFAVGAFIRSGSMLDAWTGDIADLQVYDGVFSSSDATQLYQNYGQTLPDNQVTTGSMATTLADVVDPMIGVAGGANTGENAPGACLPQASIYPSPDTSSVGPGGYIPGSNIVGFSQLHASGAGASVPSFGNFLISPRVGNGITEASDASAVSNIVAHPYEFNCTLTNWNINCALAPTNHCAIYQFAFPASSSAAINIDVARKIGSSTGMSSGSITIDPVNGIVSGGGTFAGNWNPASYNVYFYAMVDTVPASAGTWLGTTSSSGVYTQSTATKQSMGGWLNYSTAASGSTVRMKIAVSFQSVAAAQQYLQNEIPGWDLNAVAQNARTQWNNTLAAIQIPGAATADARLVYTALFHSFITPRNRTGDQASWPAGMPFWDDQYTNWDTWQTLFPLYDIISPATVASIVNSYGARFIQNGKAETVFTQGKDFQAGQGGDEVDRVIGDAWVKGIPGVNWQNAWNLLQSHANRRVPDYLNLGYVSVDGSHGGYDSRMGSGSGTIAFASDDWCAAQVAAGLGQSATAQTLLNRSRNWRNVWNPNESEAGFSGFIGGRYASGAFNASDTTTNGTDFYEGSGWNYSFDIYHDHDGMTALMGGRNRLIQRLEYALGKRSSSYIDWSNEPGIQQTFLFSYANRPYLSSYWTDQYRQLFTSYNYPGDDDSGAMSALYLFMTSGFYPIATQDYYYLFGSRLPSVQFAEGTSGNTFTVSSTNSSTQAGQNLYVQSATLNGQPLNTPIIHHSDILAGGTLNFRMGPYPTTWGCGADLQLPVLNELVLPVNGGWTAALGTPGIAGAMTSSPNWSNAGNTAIYSSFPQVALSQAGDSVTLAATVQFQGLTATSGASANLFAWGIFNSAGQSGVTGWPGYLAANDTDSSNKQWFVSKPSGNSTAYYSASGAAQLESFALPTAAFASDSYYLILTLTLNSANAIDYEAALVRASDGVLLSAFTGSDLTPATLAFNSVGLRLGSSAQASLINVSKCAVVARRTSYGGRSLVIPGGGQFISTQGAGTAANLVVNAGATFAASDAGVSSDSVGGASFAGGSIWDESLLSDGSTGQAGTNWDRLMVSGVLDFSNASDANPVTLHLITLNGSAAGPLASWNPNVSHRWVGFAGAMGGIAGFDPQKIMVDATAFQNLLAGRFSVQIGQDGTSLDLVYTAAPVITGVLNVTAIQGLPFNYQIAATNNPDSYDATGLPSGLLIDRLSGAISGTPAVGGSGSNITLAATNAGGSGTASLNLIVQSSYANWQNTMFTPAQLSNAQISGDFATPAGDGICNLMKYALGLNPMISGTTGLPTVSITAVNGTNYLTLTYQRVISRPDLTYIVDVSSDMQTWNSGAGYTAAPSIVANADGVTETVTVEDLTPVGIGNPSHYMRLRVVEQ